MDGFSELGSLRYDELASRVIEGRNDNCLEHYGIPRRSGRYPWGSGKNPFQRGNERGKDASAHKSKKVRLSDLSDEEIRTRISRLRLEKEYSDLEREMKRASIGPIQKLVGDTMESLGKKTMDNLVSKMVDKMFKTNDGKEKLDILRLKDGNIETMDQKTLEAVAKWWKNVAEIKSNREKVASNSKNSKKEKNEQGEKSDSSPSSGNKSKTQNSGSGSGGSNTGGSSSGGNSGSNAGRKPMSWEEMRLRAIYGVRR